MRVAVSGVNGFVGTHLTRELVEHGHQVVGLSVGPVAPPIQHLLSDYFDCDLTQRWPEDGADAVVHLAGLSAVGPSFADPQRYLQGNSAPVTHLGERLLATGRTPRLVLVSSGALYAPGVDIDEASPTQATSPYAVSKLLVETQAAYYRRRGLDITVMRPFNHLGPGQQPGFLLPDLIAGVRRNELTVGDLSTRRDYTDVRDVVVAYRLAVEAEQVSAPILNVCSAASVSGDELLELVLQSSGRERPPVTVEPRRLRPGDAAEIRGNNTLIAATLGWRPTIDLATSVREALAEG